MGRLWQPRCGAWRSEAERRFIAVPRKRNTATVTAALNPARSKPCRILENFIRKIFDFRKPQFFTLIDVDASRKRE
jgi:hypothetical protein